MIRPQWAWRLDDLDGNVLEDPASPLFTNQYDAEQWLGEVWRSLAARGVAAATVLHEDEPAAPTVPLVAT
jgi:hypothetical protein